MTKQVMIVTGASKGIGFETVLAGLAKGMVVVGTSRTPDKLTAKVQAKLPDKLDSFLALEMDFTSASIKRVVAEVIAKFGRIDVLVNNAGWVNEHDPGGFTTDAQAKGGAHHQLVFNLGYGDGA